ncbi:MAG: dienelactone hydrolase family protein [Planctomycetota bacterium]|nr:dienelactone hydrolase family protein [Planctomycetota bacterium]
MRRPGSRPAPVTAAWFTGLAMLLALASGAADADIVVPKKGKKLEGAIVSRPGGGVVFNIYFSRNPGVTNTEHVFRFGPDEVKRVEERPRPEVEIWRKIAAAKQDPDALAAAGAYAKEHKLKKEAAVAYALALAADETHADALKGIGGKPKWAKVKRGNPALDPAVREKLEAYVAEADAEARGALAAELKALGFPAKPHELERHRRSALQPTGYHEHVPISWRSDQQPGGSYALYVPRGYTPARTWPLIIGLHGGGPDGKLSDEVVGSGPSAMNFYRELAARRGYIVACPNALMAGWGNKKNEQLVRDLITELLLLYNVDIDRVYLTGHSMGGFGAWALGPRLAPDLAAVSPMAGGGGTVQPLIDTKTPVFIFHGADDGVVGPSSDRAKAKQLLGTGHDFIYTELPNSGHGFPASVRKELFDFFDPRRRYDKKRKTAWPRSSFLGKVSKLEKTYLGDPMAALDGEPPALDDWLDDLRLGGGKALRAVTAIAEARPEGATAGVAKVLANKKLAFDAHAYAARALGLLGDAEGAPALRKAVARPASKAQSMVAVEAAKALVAVKDAEALKALAKGAKAWGDYFTSKLSGQRMHFSDWRRALTTLSALVDAWAELATAEAEPNALSGVCVRTVFGQAIEVRTSERVPQDPSQMRVALAKALGRAHQAAAADAKAWDALLEAMEAWPKSRRAAEASRK